MSRRIALFILASLSSARAQQSSAAGLHLVPSEPIESLGRALEEKPKPAPVRPARLEIKPSSDPIYLVEESRWDGEQWRTFRTPKVDPISKDGEGVAIQGYDVISYQEKQTEKGKERFQTEYGGVLWRFATEDHKRQFLLDPSRFAPEYGGFCAYSIGRGYPATADPKAFSVLDGKVYLFFDRAVKMVWEQEAQAFIEKAGRNWPKLHR